MGWASAGGIFDPVCEALQQSFMVPEARKKILVSLIETLQENDWDTEGESLGEFQDDPVVVAAFRECGVFLWGTPEYDEEYGENSVEEKAAQGSRGQVIFDTEPRTYQCSSCLKWWKPKIPLVSCAVFHQGHGCCHYGEEEAEACES